MCLCLLHGHLASCSNACIKCLHQMSCRLRFVQNNTACLTLACGGRDSIRGGSLREIVPSNDGNFFCDTSTPRVLGGGIAQGVCYFPNSWVGPAVAHMLNVTIAANVAVLDYLEADWKCVKDEFPRFLIVQGGGGVVSGPSGGELHHRIKPGRCQHAWAVQQPLDIGRWSLHLSI